MDARYGDNTKALNSKKNRKIQEKAIRTIKFLPSNFPVLNEIPELKILKLKLFITLQNILL